MKALARAIVDLAGFLELSGDDVVDPDSAVTALESMAVELAKATPAEKRAIRAAAMERAKGARGPEKVFFQSFLDALGLDAPKPKKPATAAIVKRLKKHQA